MLKNIILDEDGLTTIEVLVVGVASAVIAVLAYWGLAGSITDASKSLGGKIKDSVNNDGATW